MEVSIAFCFVTLDLYLHYMDIKVNGWAK